MILESRSQDLGFLVGRHEHPPLLDQQHFETVIIGAGMAGMAAVVRLALR